MEFQCKGERAGCTCMYSLKHWVRFLGPVLNPKP
jgi:hypothetical protein